MLFASEMSKLLKAVLLSAYTALFIEYLKSFFSNNLVEVIEIDYVFRSPGTIKKIQRELKKYRKNITALKLNYKYPVRLPTDMKYILRWTEAFSHYNEPMFNNGQFVFLENNCSHTNCYMTNDKTLLIDPRNYDAILFDVENNWDEHSVFRNPNQKYIFMASESASNFPVCHPYFDSCYNWTWSYRLNSDIQRLFVYIYDKKGDLVGPKVNMTWIDPMDVTSVDVRKKLKSKRKAVAWFVSSCHSKSRRELVANNLTAALRKYGLKIDIYGWCGKLTCPRDRMGDCLEFLRENYFFYLSFENSLSDDYVTEKVMHAVMHYTVPIVYGGADYSRFLPPGSYINAGVLSASTIASLVDSAMKNSEEYANYFRWHNHYIYKPHPKIHEACILCKMLNEGKHSVVKDFRTWWNKDYQKLCPKEYLGMFNTQPATAIVPELK